MKLVKAHAKIYTPYTHEMAVEELKRIEMAGRTCYRSEANNDSGDLDKTYEFVKRLIKSGHESVLEHSSMTVIFVVDRALSHEIVRHRLASFSQESTRYCNYSKDKFSNELTFIKPETSLDSYGLFGEEFLNTCYEAERRYLKLTSEGVPPEIARDILPNCLATKLVVTANYREWRHIFKLRTAKAAHPKLRRVMLYLLDDVKKIIPVVFDDIQEV